MASYTCELARVGIAAEKGEVSMQLKDIKTNAFDWRWFGYNGPSSREVLATALAAMTANMVVLVDVASEQEWSPIRVLYAAKRDTLSW